MKIIFAVFTIIAVINGTVIRRENAESSLSLVRKDAANIGQPYGIIDPVTR